MSGRKLINGRYELEAVPYATGGMGEVWFGRDTRLDREIAVKFIRFPDGDENQEHVRRFVRESRITARLEHPGVPAVYDAGVADDRRPFLVMQRIRGISLADLIAEQGPLPVGWAAAIAAQICAVLAAAHQASLVHRDLKPSNVMLQPNGAVKVLDFGLAVAPNLADFSRITHTHQQLGTPAYMAPEQVEAALASPATDLYALGCTLHEMLSGKRLFDGATSYSVMNKQVMEPPVPLRELRGEVPAELERLVLDLLEKKSSDRPASAEVVYQRLMPFVGELPPLLGAVDPPDRPNPARLYAAALARVSPDSAPSAPATLDSPPAPAARPTDTQVGERANGSSSLSRQPDPARSSRLSRAELVDARRTAERLVRESRYRQAADVLSSAVNAARHTLGDTDAELIALRLELADVLFDGGDYREAAPAYARLADDLARGGDRDRVLHCRMREATCHALVGETGLALRKMEHLLETERRLLGEDDPRVTELRQQIGLLQLGAGQRQAARQTLSDLLADLKRRHGPAHPAVTEVRRLLDSLARSGQHSAV